MPTENRSSNTEMAADQLPPCADDVFKNGVSACLVGDVPKHAAETICQSLSAITGWKIDWHYIGGRTHIKALAPVAQPNPEPIAWMVGTAIWWTKEEAERDAAETGLPAVPVGPMTGTGAEIERGAWQPLTAPGQIQVGDWLSFTVAGKFICAQARLVIAPGAANEEIVYNRQKNHYFCTDMAIDGTSNHKSVLVAKSNP